MEALCLGVGANVLKELEGLLTATGIVVHTCEGKHGSMNHRPCWDLVLCGVDRLPELLPQVKEKTAGTNGGEISTAKPHLPGSRDVCLLIVVGNREDQSQVFEKYGGLIFDYIGLPVDSEILAHQLRRMSQCAELQRQIRLNHRRLAKHLGNLREQQEIMEQLNAQLLEANAALSVLAQNMEDQRTDMEKKIMFGFRKRILPILERLRHSRVLREHMAELDKVLEPLLADLPPPLPQSSHLMSRLTYMECRVAAMVSQGLSSKAISQQLGISISTVHTHRRNIRRKLRINGIHHNLKYFLQAKCPKIRPKRSQNEDENA